MRIALTNDWVMKLCQTWACWSSGEDNPPSTTGRLQCEGTFAGMHYSGSCLSVAGLPDRQTGSQGAVAWRLQSACWLGWVEVMTGELIGNGEKPGVMCELQTRVDRGPGLSWMNISSCLAFWWHCLYFGAKNSCLGSISHKPSGRSKETDHFSFFFKWVKQARQEFPSSLSISSTTAADLYAKTWTLFDLWDSLGTLL